MKRIMLLVIVILLVVPGVTKAYYYSSVRYRTRWSPYAFGLVSGDVYYSPWAFQYGHSGLIPYWFRYSPYAFSYRHPSGLISDWYSWYGYGRYYSPRVSYSVDSFAHNPSNSFEEMKKDSEEKARTRRLNIERVTQERRAAKKNNKKQIICKYLRSKNIKFRPIDGCSRANVDFWLEDMNTVLRYQNPTEVQYFENLPEHDYKRILYEKYKQRAADRFREYPVYMIRAANEEDILTGLMLCFDAN